MLRAVEIALRVDLGVVVVMTALPMLPFDATDGS